MFFCTSVKITSTMKKLFPLFALLLASCAGNQQANNETAAPAEEEVAYVDTLAANHPEYLPEIAVGAEAPNFTANDTLGQSISLTDFAGKWVVVDFWASWCGDCRREMPEVEQIYAEYADKQIKEADVQFLSYSFDRDESNWKNYLRSNNMPWPQISTLQPKWHDIQVSQDYGINWIPAFILISPDGKVAGKAITAKGLRQLIKDQK